MKIALYDVTCTMSYGGIQSFVWGMADALARRGETVHLFGGKGTIRGSAHNGVLVFTFPYLSRARIPNWGSRFRKFVERFSFGLWAFKTLTKGRYDIIYIHKPFDLPIALAAGRLSGARIVFGSGGTEFFPGYGRLVKRLDLFLACSAFNASQIEAYCGIRPEVLYNGVDSVLFKPQPPDPELSRRLRSDRSEKVIITVCRLVSLKGLQYAIEAVAVLARKFKIKYLILGDGAYRKNLEDKIDRLGLNKEIVFVGAVPNRELPRYYSVADVGVFPTIAEEAFGISIAEAMACAVPVVATRVGGVPEVAPEGTGVLVSPKDPKAL
ncbi:MAG TPA: glycosyltransferase family 4 protein, partial [Candidatus Manganitrophaceae bacterium]